MNRTLKIYIGFFVLIIIGIIIIDSNRPKPIDWTPTYATKDKIPLGLHVLNKEINSLFPKQNVERFGTTVYEFFLPKYSYDDSTYTTKGTVLLISENNTLDDASVNELLYFVSHGNTAFLSMKNFPEKLRDSLNFDFENQFLLTDSLRLSLTNQKISAKKFNFRKGIGFSHFNKTDSLNTVVLGYQETDTLKKVNFISVPYKNGNFFLHTQPAAFSNYNLLYGNNHEYCASILSYVPNGNVFWGAKSFGNPEISNSPMRYILSQPALKWAWYLFLLGMLAFMIFNAKRRQRIIPIKVPLQNTTVDFTKTIGNLYLQEGNHHLIIDKKIIYFLEKIRTDYLIDTFNLDETFVNRLQQKTGKDKTDIENVVRLIKRHRNHLESSEKDVIEISKAIEKIAQK